MRRISTIAFTLAAAVALSGCIIVADGGTTTVVHQTVPAEHAYAAALAHPDRPEADRARDGLRRSADMLAFMRLSPGDVIADIRPEEGFFTRLFAPVVGPAGHVYAFVPNQTAERENVYADTLSATYGNVSRVTGALETMAFDRPLDVVFMGEEYHDFVIPRFGVDVPTMNAAVFRALKPGGLYVILDHQAAPGAGVSAVGTLHRIESTDVRRQVEAAGFVFDGETRVVANPADDHSLSVFDPAIRGRTDRFVLRFRKPG